MAQISGTGMGGSTAKKVDLAAAAKKTASAAAPTTKTSTTAAKAKVTPAPAKAKEPVVSAAKKVASAAKPSIKSGSGGSSPTKRAVQTTTVRPKTSDPVGDGPSLGMLYDFMGTPAASTRDVPVAPASRLRGTPADVPGDVFPSFAEYLDVVSPSFSTRPAGGLNSDAYYERAAEAGGKPFEGVVDWGGIASAVGLGGQPDDVVDITVRGGTPTKTTLTDAERRALAYYVPDRLTPGVSTANKTMPPTVITGTPADTSIDRAYSAEAGYSEPLQAIDAAAAPIGLPRRDPRGYASNDLFMTDGQVTLPDGSVITPGAPAAGIDAAAVAAPKETTMWDGVVDNAGKLLEHTGLGGVVKELFPDIWYGGGEAMKGLDDGNSGTRDLNAERKRSNERARERFRQQQAANPQPDGGGRFPDLNHNGIDDRIEGYTGPDTGQPPANPAVPVWDLPPTRVASFPNMPPYNPGRDNEWSYFTNNHLADGGIVDAYAEGGAVDGNDPRMALIGQTEDVLEKIAGGAKPDARDAEVLKAFVAQFGDAALKSLNDNVTGGMTMKSGRMIKGPGGPKDDAVPAVIVEEGSVVSPAKLSNNEFVMPVSAVEGIGEGDVEMGAQRMQELADRLSRKSAA